MNPGSVVQVPVAATLVVVGVLLLRFAGSATPTGAAGGNALARLPFSPFAGRPAETTADHPAPGTVVAYWLLGSAMLLGGVAVAVAGLV